MSAEPSEGALDDPPAREQNETAGGVRALDDFQVDGTKIATKATDPINELPGVSRVGPEFSKSKERRCQDGK